MLPNLTLVTKFFVPKRIVLLLKYILFFGLVVIFIHKITSLQIIKNQHNEEKNVTFPEIRNTTKNIQIAIAITICGDQSLKQGMNALKSALILSKHKLHFIIMTDSYMFSPITHKFDDLERQHLNFSYELHQIEYPNTKISKTWRKLFKECASQRLFLPEILYNRDSLLYIDTDVVFLSPVEELWSFLSKMNSSQIAAMAYESEDFSSNWYHRFAKHPYYGYYGVNSGVMLMNLTRMRRFKWNEKLEPILLKFKNKIVWGDQDIINIIFSFNPDKLYLFGCDWNYRPDHCIYSSTCKAAETNGIRILHGNRGSFINDKQPEFKAVFNAFEKFDLRENSKTNIAKTIESHLVSLKTHSNCQKVISLFWEAINKYN